MAGLLHLDCLPGETLSLMSRKNCAPGSTVAEGRHTRDLLRGLGVAWMAYLSWLLSKEFETL